MAGWRPWQYVALGAFGVVLVLGVTGGLASVRPLDRLLNPDARNYWESEAGYVESQFSACSDASSKLLDEGASEEQSLRYFEQCYDARIERAIDRGDVTEKGLREANPGGR